jgi:hypothetical protein
VDDVAAIIANIATHAKQHDAATRAALQPLPPAAKRLSMTIPIGTAVLDLVSGEKGVVIDGKHENVAVLSTTNAAG